MNLIINIQQVNLQGRSRRPIIGRSDPQKIQWSTERTLWLAKISYDSQENPGLRYKQFKH